jgi:hypothetical protein
MHYTVWNPAGPRLRRYTDNPQEPALIESIRKALPAIRNATRLIFMILQGDLCGPELPRQLKEIGCFLKQFLGGLRIAVNQVSPAIFIQHFRPFFESFRVGAKEYRGPGAVTMPLHILDFLLWGSSEADERYQQFTAAYIPYNTAELRSIYLYARNNPSLLDRVSLEVNQPTSKANVGLLSRWCGVYMKYIIGFRSAHVKYAMKAYHGSTTDSFVTGSGGHTTADLEYLSSLTTKHAASFVANAHAIAMLV